MRLAAVDAVAAGEGVGPGMTLADARAVLPSLRVAMADPVGDRAALEALADWCGRWSPWTATDGADGLVLEITGVAHLFGGEEAFAALIAGTLDGLGLSARIAVADSPAAGWALARFADAGGRPLIVPAGEGAAALDPLPVAALRLEADTVAALDGLGLRTIGALAGLARGPLVHRFGPGVMRRLDRALAREDEPVTPRRPPAACRSRLAWPEPIGHLADIEAATGQLLDTLVDMLDRRGEGARRLELALYRVDGEVRRVTVGTSLPSRTSGHLMRLFRERIGDLDLGFGVETMILSCLVAAPLPPRQAALPADRAAGADPAARPGLTASAAMESLGELVDRLENRLGPRRVVRARPFGSHLPERAVERVPALGEPFSGGVTWPGGIVRPLRLLPVPEPVEVEAAGPGAVPDFFRWRRIGYRVARAEGPERLGPEWWHEVAAQSRDYYRIEDLEGRRFWLFRQGLLRERGPAAERAGLDWFLHGLFA
ncbi:DNA polymerase IV [Oceanibacterium hippocampi]|uniref:DNA polymerase IV n=1 Tax=Oceanibacterium hippocampi TaxID=745714 RepID=A0A1Y5SH58_9PROT|nr:DNA polymerase IV [Oceanibacterium hippocampi]